MQSQLQARSRVPARPRAAAFVSASALRVRDAKLLEMPLPSQHLARQVSTSSLNTYGLCYTATHDTLQPTVASHSPPFLSLTLVRTHASQSKLKERCEGSRETRPAGSVQEEIEAARP